MPGPTASRGRSGSGRNPCSYCQRDGRHVVHAHGKFGPKSKRYSIRSCRGKGARAFD